MSPCLQFTVTYHPCKTIASSLAHCHISSMQNRRIVSTSLPVIIYAELSHCHQFSPRYHTCRTVALSPVHFHVSSVQNYRVISISLSRIIYADCHIVTSSLPGIIYVTMAHYLQFAGTYHICRTVILSPVHCHVSYMQNCHIISSSLARIVYAELSQYI